MAATNKQIVPLFDPAVVPFRGQNSACNAGALDPGEVMQVVNFRARNRKLTPRYGDVLDKAAPLSGAGTLKGILWNSLGIWEAVWDPATSKVKIYQWNSAGSAWVEISDSTTRFTNNIDVHFTIITEKVYPDVGTFSDVNNTYIVWQNGTELPRIRNCASDFGGTYTPSIHQKFTIPAGNATKSQPRPLNYFNTQAITARTNDGGATVSSSSQSYTSGGTYEQFTITTGASSGKWAQVQFTSAITPAVQPTQLHIIFDASDAFLFTKLRISLTTGSGGTPASTRYIVYDPATNPQALTIVPIDDKFSQAVIDLQTIYDSSLVLVTTGLPATALDRLRFDWMTTAPAANVTLNVYYAGFGSNVRWGIQAGCAFFGSQSRAESPGRIAQYLNPPTIKEVGGTPVPNLTLAKSTACTYRLTCWTARLSTLGNDADRLCWYLGADYGSDFYQRDANATTASGYSNNAFIVVDIDSEDTIPRLMPDSFYESIPVARCSLAFGDRLFCGNARVAESAVTAGDGEVWFSWAGYQNRFRRITAYQDGTAVPESGTVIQAQGGKVQSLHPIPGTIIGADTIFVFCEAEVYGINGADSSLLSKPFRVSPYGTYSPLSVASSNGVVYYLDEDRQVRSIYGRDGLRDLSLSKVDDKLAGIGDSYLPSASGAFWDNKYYLGFAPSGATSNEQALIWDEQIGGWLTDSQSGTLRYTRFFAVSENSRQKLFYATATGAIYHHENNTATDDAGDTIVSRIRFPEIRNGFLRLAIERIGISALALANKYFTTRRYTAESSTSPTSGKVDIGTSITGKTKVYRWDRDASSAAVKLGANDFGFMVDVEIQGGVGTEVSQIIAEVRGVDTGYELK